MRLSDYLDTVIKEGLIAKSAILLCDVDLDNGESRKKGSIVTIMSKTKDGKFRAEHNDWSCILEANEFRYV